MWPRAISIFRLGIRTLAEKASTRKYAVAEKPEDRSCDDLKVPGRSHERAGLEDVADRGLPRTRTDRTQHVARRSRR